MITNLDKLTKLQKLNNSCPAVIEFKIIFSLDKEQCVTKTLGKNCFHSIDAI